MIRSTVYAQALVEMGVEPAKLTELRDFSGKLAALRDESTGTVILRRADCVTLVPPAAKGNVTAVSIKMPERSG
jgi:hypothetical protein